MRVPPSTEAAVRFAADEADGEHLAREGVDHRPDEDRPHHALQSSEVDHPECAGINRRGVADERAAQARPSQPV